VLFLRYLQSHTCNRIAPTEFLLYVLVIKCARKLLVKNAVTITLSSAYFVRAKIIVI